MTDEPAPPPPPQQLPDPAPSPATSGPPPTAAPAPSGYAVPAPPPGTPVAATRRSRGSRRLWIIVGVVAVLLVIGIVGETLARNNSHFSIVPSSSTDGTFSAGDCVTLTSTTVHKTGCVGPHDAQIIQVIHGSQSCPAGTDEFDVSDGTGNLCVDKSNSSQ